MTTSRRLSRAARAAIKAKLAETPLVGGPALALSAVPETKLQGWETLVGLDRPNAEFRERIADAIFWAVCFHHLRPKRARVVRNDLRSIERRANAAVAGLTELSGELQRSTFARWPEFLEPRLARLASAIDVLQTLAADAGRRADKVGPDKGGPTKSWAFDDLITLVADAFEFATGQPATVTWSQHRERYEGKFCDLTEQVLPCVEKSVGSRIAPKSARTRGREIQKILTAIGKTRTS